MAKIVDLVQDLAQPLAEELGLELFFIEYVKEGAEWYLRVYIDKPEGVNIDDCENMSRRLSDELDRVDPIEGQYNLEVSSPGLERPLRHEDDLRQNIGNLIQITTFAPVAGKKKMEGRLEAFEDGVLVLAVGKEELRVAYSQVAKARLAIEF